MLLDLPRRYCRNLTAFIVSKPPCVVFTICLCCLAIALFWLGYYINNNDVVDPEAEKDWNDFLTSLSNVQFCIDKVNSKVNQHRPKSINDTKKRGQNSKYESPTSTYGLQLISIPLKIGVHVRNKDHFLHGNITHLTALMDAPTVGSGLFRRKMNLTFSLSKVWDTEERKCNKKNNLCKLPQGYFHSCVTILAPREALPEWKPETCNSTSFSSLTNMKALTKKSQHSKCESGAVIYFKHPVDLEVREKLSVDERAKANLHLQVTSYFLFILVISSIIYGMLKGKPLKSKKVTFESNGL
ncbi:transmembrane protein 248-like [Dendronephthya gigantea]|uniref:transmembrane protein 248-like n=1 Tax=Dendronephthya gigantea TaxID=151771 RepID=UPI00106C54D4|nr:transmembrane protein 248-like [Dendronephthya gigantea]